MPPSMRVTSLSFMRLVIDSDRPTICMAAPTALAKEKMTPIDPPNSGPKERLIMKYVPPPFTIPFVQIAHIDSAVIDVTSDDSKTIAVPYPLKHKE